MSFQRPNSRERPWMKSKVIIPSRQPTLWETLPKGNLNPRPEMGNRCPQDVLRFRIGCPTNTPPLKGIVLHQKMNRWQPIILVDNPEDFIHLSLLPGLRETVSPLCERRPVRVLALTVDKSPEHSGCPLETGCNSPIQSSDFCNYGERGIRPSANRADAGVVHKAFLLPQSVKSLQSVVQLPWVLNRGLNGFTVYTDFRHRPGHKQAWGFPPECLPVLSQKAGHQMRSGSYQPVKSYLIIELRF